MQAQQQYKKYYDANHRDLQLEVDQWVWLRIQHRKATSIVLQPQGKYGPYQVTEKIASAAYRLRLPAKAKLHDVFHVSLLKPFVGQPPSSPPPLPDLYHGKVFPVPDQVLRTRKARCAWQILVQWQGLTAADASWEDVVQFKQHYPSFQLEDNLFLGDPADVMWGRTYTRRHRKGKENTSGSVA